MPARSCRGKTLGVIGLGAIGARVANAAVALGMEVLGDHPDISIDAAWSLSRSVQHCADAGRYAAPLRLPDHPCPLPAHDPHTINAQTLSMCKDGVRVLNFARGELVDTEALLDAHGTPARLPQYFCDFPAEELLGVKGVYCTPHLGATTPESETNCAVMAAAELKRDLLRRTATSPTASTCRTSASPARAAAASATIHKNDAGRRSRPSPAS